MKIKHINLPYVQNLLDQLGFKKRTQMRFGVKVSEYCYYGNGKRKGNESPTLVIDDYSGIISMWCSTTYYKREIPNVLLTLIQNDLVVV